MKLEQVDVLESGAVEVARQVDQILLDYGQRQAVHLAATGALQTLDQNAHLVYLRYCHANTHTYTHTIAIKFNKQQTNIYMSSQK